MKNVLYTIKVNGKLMGTDMSSSDIARYQRKHSKGRMAVYIQLPTTDREFKENGNKLNVSFKKLITLK